MEPFNSGAGLEAVGGEVEGLRESTDCRLQAAGSEVFRSLVVRHGGDFGKSENGRRKAEIKLSEFNVSAEPLLSEVAYQRGTQVV